MSYAHFVVSVGGVQPIVVEVDDSPIQIVGPLVEVGPVHIIAVRALRFVLMDNHLIVGIPDFVLSDLVLFPVLI